MSKPYRVCPDCGASLDPGEICDCQKQKEEHELQFHGNLVYPFRLIGVGDIVVDPDAWALRSENLQPIVNSVYGLLGCKDTSAKASAKRLDELCYNVALLASILERWCNQNE